MQMSGGRIVLALDGLLFAAFGAAYIAIPETMAAKVGIALQTGGAIIDVQGLYGGLELGLGLFLLWCARAPARTVTGLVLGSLILSCIGVVRLVSIARFGLPDSSVAGLVGMDLVGAALNVFFWRRYRAPSAA